jgi:hypothetical protein
MPSGLTFMEDDWKDMIYNPPAKAGDVIIFLEGTIHGTIPWSNPDHERRSLLYRYTQGWIMRGQRFHSALPSCLTPCFASKHATKV